MYLFSKLASRKDQCLDIKYFYTMMRQNRNRKYLGKLDRVQKKELKVKTFEIILRQALYLS